MQKTYFQITSHSEVLGGHGFGRGHYSTTQPSPPSVGEDAVLGAGDGTGLHPDGKVYRDLSATGDGPGLLALDLEWRI